MTSWTMRPPLLRDRRLLLSRELLSLVMTVERPDNKRGQESLERRRRKCPEATEDVESALETGVEEIGADKAAVVEKETTLTLRSSAGDAAEIIENLKADP